MYTTSNINLEDIGKKVLELTNEQRRFNNLKDLQWSGELYKIAEEHSKNMATKGVLGHDGIQDRFKKIPFPTVVNTENVAYHNDRRNPANAAVKIWLGIEGNMRNMFGNYSHAAVGVARANNGDFYFTQLISLAKD